MRHHVFHGTNQAFDRFDAGMLGMNNPNHASRQAFFFAADPETAWDYARQAARNLLPGQVEHEARVARIMERAQAEEARGRFAAAESLWLEAERLETDAMQAPPEGARVYRCEIGLENPMFVDGRDRHVVTDLGALISEARRIGHDGVIVTGICDTPSGGGRPDDHFAVFDPDRIRILEILEDVAEAEPDFSP